MTQKLDTKACKAIEERYLRKNATYYTSQHFV